MESSHHFAYHRPPFDMILTFSFFDILAFFKILKSHVRSNIFRNRYFLGQIRNQRPQKHNKGWWGVQFAEIMVITTRPIAYLVGWPGVTMNFLDMMLCDIHCFLNGSGVRKHADFIYLIFKKIEGVVSCHFLNFIFYSKIFKIFKNQKIFNFCTYNRLNNCIIHALYQTKISHQLLEILRIKDIETLCDVII